MYNFFLKVYNNLISTHRWSLMFKSTKSSEYIHIDQPLDIARADCFIVEHDEKIFVFFEEFKIEPNRKGVLCVGELDAVNCTLRNIKIVLEKPYHLSYPFVFKLNNNWYMIPESHSNRTIDLYQFIIFPYEIKKIKTLVFNIDAVDTTLIHKDGFFYLLTNVKDKDCVHNNNLSIFYSQDLLNGEFLPHPMNPVKKSATFSRMAGRITEHDSLLYRYAQDCSFIYGSKIYKFKINELTKDVYDEELVLDISPPKGCHATHTYGCSNNYEIIDVMRVNYSIKNLVFNFIRLLNQLLKLR